MSILLFSNNAITTLASAITNTAVTVNLTPGSGALFPSPIAGEYFKLTFTDVTGLINEIVHVTNRSGDTLTIVRGQEGTSALPWSAGDTAALLCTAGVLSSFIQSDQLQIGTYSVANSVGGTANAITATLASNQTNLPDQMSFSIKATAANTGPVTLALTLGTTLQTTYPVVKLNNQPLIAGDISGANYSCRIIWSAAYSAYILTNPATTTSPAQIQNVTASVASNALTITYAGGTLDFRNAIAANGAPISGVAVPSNAITIPSGATLGSVNGISMRVVVLEAYNGGSPVMCVVNLAGGVQLDETNFISPTVISSGSTSASTIYCASTVSSNSPYRIIGFVDISEATAGTYATAPTLVQGIGGQALASMCSLGYGQQYTDVTASRSFNTTYYNTTGKPILVEMYATSTGATTNVLFSVNGSPSIVFGGTASGQAMPLSFVVPPGGSYVISNTNSTITKWIELR